jgi:hypothetical protein
MTHTHDDAGGGNEAVYLAVSIMALVFMGVILLAIFVCFACLPVAKIIRQVGNFFDSRDSTSSLLPASAENIGKAAILAIGAGKKMKKGVPVRFLLSSSPPPPSPHSFFNTPKIKCFIPKKTKKVKILWLCGVGHYILEQKRRRDHHPHRTAWPQVTPVRRPAQTPTAAAACGCARRL